MCLICVDFQRQKMTLTDAKRAYREMSSSLDHQHAREIEVMLRDADVDQEGKLLLSEQVADGAQ